MHGCSKTATWKLVFGIFYEVFWLISYKTQQNLSILEQSIFAYLDTEMFYLLEKKGSIKNWFLGQISQNLLSYKKILQTTAKPSVQVPML